MNVQKFMHLAKKLHSLKLNGIRYLHLHEYQSKELMSAFGVNTQRFVMAESGNEAIVRAAELSISLYSPLFLLFFQKLKNTW